jgi:hypothetical protein
MYRTLVFLLAALAVNLFCTAPALAQATRTVVSGVGDDANPCSRTAPCQTWAGAFPKTATGGEMDSLDPGVFGVLTITHAIMLDGGGGQSSVIVNPSTAGITIAAGPGDVVILRNLRFNGIGTGLDGVKILSAGLVVLDNVVVTGQAQNAVEVALANGAACAVIVKNSNFTGGATGVKLTSGNPSVALDHVSIRGAGAGVDAAVGTVEVKDSFIVQSSSFGVYAEGGAIDVDNSFLSGNGVAAQAQTGSVVRMNSSDLFNNLAGFGCGGGTLASGANNRKGGNGGSMAPICAPNSTISIQ